MHPYNFLSRRICCLFIFHLPVVILLNTHQLKSVYECVNKFAMLITKGLCAPASLLALIFKFCFLTSTCAERPAISYPGEFVVCLYFTYLFFLLNTNQLKSVYECVNKFAMLITKDVCAPASLKFLQKKLYFFSKLFCPNDSFNTYIYVRRQKKWDSFQNHGKT